VIARTRAIGGAPIRKITMNRMPLLSLFRMKGLLIAVSLSVILGGCPAFAAMPSKTAGLSIHTVAASTPLDTFDGMTCVYTRLSLTKRAVQWSQSEKLLKTACAIEREWRPVQ